MSEKETLLEAVKLFPERMDARPVTIGPAPNDQIDQFPTEGYYDTELLEYGKTFEGVLIGSSYTPGESSRAFFINKYSHLRGIQTQFLVGNEFAHIHDGASKSLHAVLPPEIAGIVYTKKWGEQHPLARLGYAGSTNNLLYGARNRQEAAQLKTLLRISYLFANRKW